MATDGERSLKSGVFPNWMKVNEKTYSYIKTNILTTIQCGYSTSSFKRLDFDQGTFSPPEHDDNFFLIRYPRATSEPKANNSVLKNVTELTNSSGDSTAKIDFSKHTAPCQKFISRLPDNSTGKPQNLPPDTKVKSYGTDDGFKGEAAMCGSSVIRVASQMVSSKVTRGFFPSEDYDSPPKGFNPSMRRGSKSLPASPLQSPNASPKSRKRLPNKYFTGTFNDGEKYQGSWILANLLGKRETLSRSVDVINEEEHTSELVKSVSNLSLIEEAPKPSAQPKQVFKAKPSELREMNFWSPTSM